LTRIETLGYPIVIDSAVEPHLSAFAQARGTRRAVILADANVARRAKSLAAALSDCGPVAVETFTLGERRKTLRTFGRALRALAAARADRATLVVGVGGGVASDVFGFAAAAYMRGVPYATVSTTLVGMADASVGGKTGVDLPEGKNLAGVFRDPVAVFCDLGALETLPARELREGLAEVVKAAIIAGEEPFARLESLARRPLREWPWEDVIAQALALKCDVVSRDREERGLREVLNLGHTFGHAIELVSGYRVSHGSAVSAGICAAGALALETGRFSPDGQERVVGLLTALKLPAGFAGFRPGSLVRAMRADKKTRDGEVRFVVPRAIGEVETGVTAPGRVIKEVLTQVSTRSRNER
jgi:3-dehydroquinate synthase